jgi:hypothetical protein
MHDSHGSHGRSRAHFLRRTTACRFFEFSATVGFVTSIETATCRLRPRVFITAFRRLNSPYQTCLGIANPLFLQDSLQASPATTSGWFSAHQPHDLGVSISKKTSPKPLPAFTRGEDRGRQDPFQTLKCWEFIAKRNETSVFPASGPTAGNLRHSCRSRILGALGRLCRRIPLDGPNKTQDCQTARHVRTAPFGCDV